MKKISLIFLLSIIVLVSACSDSDDSSSSDSSTSSTAAAIANECKDEPALDPAKTYTVVMTTTQGAFTITLDVKDAPVSSAHFASLVQEGFYDGLTFHRVVPDFVIQGGDPNGDGTGSSDCSVISEAPTRDYQAQDLAWAKTGSDPAGHAGSQFFVITASPAASGLAALNQAPQQYGFIGTVTSGYDVVEKIELLGDSSSETGAPLERVEITKAELKS